MHNRRGLLSAAARRCFLLRRRPSHMLVTQPSYVVHAFLTRMYDGKEKKGAGGPQAIEVDDWEGREIRQSLQSQDPLLPGVGGPSVSPRVCLLILYRHPACLPNGIPPSPDSRFQRAGLLGRDRCSLHPNHCSRGGSTHRVSGPCSHPQVQGSKGLPRRLTTRNQSAGEPNQDARSQADHRLASFAVVNCRLVLGGGGGGCQLFPRHRQQSKSSARDPRRGGAHHPTPKKELLLGPMGLQWIASWVSLLTVYHHLPSQFPLGASTPLVQLFHCVSRVSTKQWIGKIRPSAS
ncbi:hypothetical protein LY78DRAFT_346010 [Colletotrichum sublineola]|nr:hypothetical protein LY78DRAFT_346010 [Colletotrichum sublineola]